MSDSEVVENFRSGRFSIRYSNELSRCTGVGARKLESGEVVGDSPAPDGDPVDPVDPVDAADDELDSLRDPLGSPGSCGTTPFSSSSPTIAISAAPLAPMCSRGSGGSPATTTSPSSSKPVTMRAAAPPEAPPLGSVSSAYVLVAAAQLGDRASNDEIPADDLGERSRVSSEVVGGGLFLPLPGIRSALVFFVKRRASTSLNAPKFVTSSTRLSRSVAKDGMTVSIKCEYKSAKSF